MKLRKFTHLSVENGLIGLNKFYHFDFQEDHEVETVFHIKWLHYLKRFITEGLFKVHILLVKYRQILTD